MTRSSLVSSIAVAVALSATGAAAQSAHVHGEGRLNIAIEGNRIVMALESPGADIVGFEHKAKSSAEKSAVKAAIEQLETPLQLMRFVGDADCRVSKAHAELESDEHDEHGHNDHGHDDEHDGHDDHAHEEHDHDEHAHEEHDDDDHAHDEHEDHAHEEHDHDDHADDHGEETHSAFHAEYAFDCSDADALSAIEFTYFDRFENAQSLDIVLIDSSGQRSVEVDRADPVLTLAR